MQETTTDRESQGQGAQVDPFSYDRILVAFSGGKDSLACVLHLLDLGVPKERIELWHHEIDGREGSTLMDWAVTPDYCRKVAEALGLPIYFSWKVGGFEGEMLRTEAKSLPVRFETPEGEVVEVGGKGGKVNTRRRFPALGKDLSSRWCSAYLKIDVMSAAINNQARFLGARTLVVTGERAEESGARAKYKEVERHRTDNHDGKFSIVQGERFQETRTVDHWRPVHKWTEAQVWEIIGRYKVNAHPCYHLGWSRCSCETCIFGSKCQWASVKIVNPEKFERIAEYERKFKAYWKGTCPKCRLPLGEDGRCPKCRGKAFGGSINPEGTVEEMAEKGTAYQVDEAEIAKARKVEYDEPVILDEWTLPAGAFGEDNAGPV